MKVLNGKYYVLPAYNTPLPMNYIENYYYKGLNNPEMRIILGKNKNGRFSSYSDRNTMGKVILQSKFDEERSNFHGYKNDKVYTGCIKMYPAWVTEVNSNTYFDNKKLRESDSCIVIIGFKPHKYFYDNLDEYEKILGETIDGIRKFYPSTLIVVKLKALEVRDNNKWIYKFLDTYNDENLIADYSPLPFLAKKAIFAVLNQASTSFFDFMINQVPYIEHAHYGLNFNSVQSEGSFLRNFKATVSTKNVTELEEAILMIKNNNFPIMSEKEIVNRFNYINDTEIFKKL
jgi:hypothetical protein